MTNYTIQKLADLAGVTVRTLHHYDEIGLLTPKRGEGNSYRLYSQSDAQTLQQIMFFRELEFSLEEIKNILNSPNYNKEQVLIDHKKLLEIKKEKLNKVIKILDETMKDPKNISKASFDGFSDYEMSQHKDEVKAKWGNTNAYIQSQERTKNWTKEDYKRVGENGKTLTREISLVMNLPVSDHKVQELIKQHHISIEVFYDCPMEMYRGLGQMYVTDPRFTKYYEDVKPGLAKFVSEAIDYYCSNQ